MDSLQTVERAGENPTVIYLASLSSGSRRTMQQALRQMAEVLSSRAADEISLPWQMLRYQHVVTLRQALTEKYSHTTANKMLSAIRGVLKACWKLGLMTAEEYQSAASVENVKGQRPVAGRAITSQEIKKLLHTCQGDATGIRDKAILMIMYRAGLRRAEVTALHLVDFDGDTLRVKGKRNKVRDVPLTADTIKAIKAWLAVRNSEPGPLFLATETRNSTNGLSTQAIYEMLRKRANLAGITAISPHDFRRTFVGDLLDAGADIVTVQKLAGHANVETTARYDRRGEAAKRKAIALLT